MLWLPPKKTLFRGKHDSGAPIIMPRKRKWGAIWDFEGVCSHNGEHEEWEDRDRHNLITDEGEQYILEVVFSEAQSVPASYYIGLSDETAIAEADTLPVDDEPTGNGYAREAVNSDGTDFTVAVDAGDYQATTKTVTFTASGGAIPDDAGTVNAAFLATTLNDTGVLVSFVALSTARTVADGDAMNVSMVIKLSE